VSFPRGLGDAAGQACICAPLSHLAISLHLLLLSKLKYEMVGTACACGVPSPQANFVSHSLTHSSAVVVGFGHQLAHAPPPPITPGPGPGAFLLVIILFIYLFIYLLRFFISCFISFFLGSLASLVYATLRHTPRHRHVQEAALYTRS
jgi:hypothetical protein